MREKILKTKNFVAKHRGKIVFVGTAGTCLWLNYRSLAEVRAFLDEKGLLEEFYTPEMVA